MIAVTLISVVSVVVLGILSSITDIRFHKVKNRHIAVFACLGLVLQVATIALDSSLTLSLLINIFLAFAISVAFYCAKIWAAGDAKLFSTIIMLAPYSMMTSTLNSELSSLIILGFTFTIAMIYVAVESVALFIRDMNAQALKKYSSFKGFISKKTITSWITAYVIIDFADCLIKLIGKSHLYQNPFLILIFHLLIANASISLIKDIRWKLIISGGVLTVRVFLTIFRFFPIPTFSIWTLVIITVILLLKWFTGRYNYQAIPTDAVSEGQVLAQSTIAAFLVSKADNLPSYSDESTRCRLTEAEASAIRAWGKTKNGKSTIVIVKIVPFAPFISIGALATVAICAFM